MGKGSRSLGCAYVSIAPHQPLGFWDLSTLLVIGCVPTCQGEVPADTSEVSLVRKAVRWHSLASRTWRQWISWSEKGLDLSGRLGPRLPAALLQFWKPKGTKCAEGFIPKIMEDRASLAGSAQPGTRSFSPRGQAGIARFLFFLPQPAPSWAWTALSSLMLRSLLTWAPQLEACCSF